MNQSPRIYFGEPPFDQTVMRASVFSFFRSLHMKEEIEISGYDLTVTDIECSSYPEDGDSILVRARDGEYTVEIEAELRGSELIFMAPPPQLN